MENSKWSLLGSASTLEGLVALIKSKWAWKEVNLHPVEVNGVVGSFRITSGNGKELPNLRILPKGKRFRLEIL